MSQPERTPPDLPGVLAQIANVAGEEAAVAIAEAVGGTQVYIPPVPDADHWMSRLVGHKAALAIADRLTLGVGGIRLDMPSGPSGYAAKTRQKVDRMIAAGRSERDIALATGYTGRGVRKRRRLSRERDARQPRLI